MDTPLTRAEHEEFRRTVEGEFKRADDENKRQNKRLDSLERVTEQIAALTTSVEKLAVSVEDMAKVQSQQSERLKVLEGRDGELWRRVIAYIITATIGIVIGFVFNQLGM